MKLTKVEGKHEVVVKMPYGRYAFVAGHKGVEVVEDINVEPSFTLELSLRDAQILHAICGSITGSGEVRIFIDNMWYALNEKGINTQLVNKGSIDWGDAKLTS